MAGERALPGLGLSAYFTDGSSGWGTTRSDDIRKTSALTQCRVISRTTSLPGSPTDGDMYIIPTGDTDAEEIAIRDNGAWVNFAAAEGWTAYVEDEDRFVTFMGTGWIEAYMLYDLGFFFASTFTNDETVARFVAVRPFTIPASTTGSEADAGAASTGDVSFSIQKGTTEFATCRFNISASGVFTQASAESFAIGDILRIRAPSASDTTLADVAMTLKGVLKE